MHLLSSTMKKITVLPAGYFDRSNYARLVKDRIGVMHMTGKESNHEYLSPPVNIKVLKRHKMNLNHVCVMSTVLPGVGVHIVLMQGF